MISDAKESELVKAIDDRIEYLRQTQECASAHAQMVGLFEGVLPMILNEEQADQLILRLNTLAKRVRSLSLSNTSQ